MQPPPTARLNFLTSASHLLAHTATQTSALLTTRRNELLLETHPLPLPLSVAAQREHACTACGHIFIPGQGGDTITLRSDTPKAKKPQRQKPGKHAPARTTGKAPPLVQQHRASTAGEGRRGVSKVLTCGTCASTTVVKVVDAPRPRSRKLVSSTTTAQQQQQTSNSAAASGAASMGGKSTSNASSKKRAKNRKAGLQALLEQKKPAASSGLGLSLADFMMK